MNFKQWLDIQEAIEYQPENWLKFHRQMINKFKRFEAKYTHEFLQELKKEIQRLKDDYCSTREKNFLESAGDYVSYIARIFEDWYQSASNEMDYISGSKCGEISSRIEKYNSVFMYAKDSPHYRKHYDEFLNDFENETTYRYNCGDERYQEVMPVVNTIKNLVKDFDDYLKNTKIVTDKHKIRCYVYYKRYEKGGASDLKDRSDFPPHQDVEYMYHATSNLPAILSQGFKYKSELESPTGLGGGESNVISFTSNPNIANTIASALKQAVKIAKGTVSSQEIINRYKRLNLITDEDIEESKREFTKDNEVAFKLFRLANFRRDQKGLRYDPWFGFHNFESFSKTNIDDIGVIKAKIDMSKVKSYHVGEEEYRVPKEAIIEIEKCE